MVQTEDEIGDWPLPRAGEQDLLDAAPWLSRQSALALPLADAALAVGRLDADLAGLDETRRAGFLRRLALAEVEALLWVLGRPLARDEIGRDLMDARATSDLEAMRFARWAIRRLEGQGGESLRDFLGLHSQPPTGAAMPRLTGDSFDDAALVFGEAMGHAQGLHPLARAPFALLAWRMTELSPPEEATAEALVWIARDMARGCEALTFLPIAAETRRTRSDAGPVEGRMEAHLAALTAGARAARLLLRRVGEWQDRALRATQPVKGNSPARVIEVLAAHPLVSAPDVEKATGLSRITAERMLNRLEDLQQIREITGTRRFRLWTARL